MSTIRRLVRALELSKLQSVVVHSNLLGISLPPPSPQELFDEILAEMGTGASIAVPTYTLTNDRPFERTLTPSVGVGAFSEFVRTLPNTYRTNSVLHSHAVLGRESKYFSRLPSTVSFGDGSDFDIFAERDFFLVLLGVDFLKGATFLHHLEQKAAVPYRREIILRRRVVSDGEIEEVHVPYFARTSPDIRTDFNRLIPLLENQAETFRTLRIGLKASYVVSLRELESVVLKELTNNPEFFLVTSRD